MEENIRFTTTLYFIDATIIQRGYEKIRAA